MAGEGSVGLFIDLRSRYLIVVLVRSFGLGSFLIGKVSYPITSAWATKREEKKRRETIHSGARSDCQNDKEICLAEFFFIHS